MLTSSPLTQEKPLIQESSNSNTPSVFGHHPQTSRSGKRLFFGNKGKYFGEKVQYFLGGLALSLMIIGGGVAYNLVQQEGVGETRRQASGQMITVCPNGSAGEKNCDYIGGSGIQQAVEIAADNALITIKAGVYTRSDFTQYQVDGSVADGKGFIVVDQEKSLTIRGEGFDQTILDGAMSGHELTGIVLLRGNVIVEQLAIKGMRKSPEDCFVSEGQVCGAGIGILLMNGTHASINHNLISENLYIGIFMQDEAQANISHNIINRNGDSGIYLRDVSQADIENNTFLRNQLTGVEFYMCEADCPTIDISNNIISYTKKSAENTYGYAIGGSCIYAKPESIAVSYNLIWANEGQGTSCYSEELCDFLGKIEVDPQFVDPSNNDFRIQNPQACVGGEDGTYLGAFPCW